MEDANKRTIPASVSIEDLEGLDEVIDKLNKANGKRFLNRSQVINTSLTLGRVREAVKEASHLKDKQKKAITLSLSPESVDLLDGIGEEQGTTRSLMLDIAIRYILKLIRAIEAYCKEFIVGICGGEYLVPVSLLLGSPNMGEAHKKAILESGKVIDHYDDGEFVLIQYEALFNGFLLGGK